MSPKIVDKKKKRAHIRDSAMIVFGKYGYEKTRMTDVAKQAKIGKGTIYEYFESKEEIFFEIFKNFFEELGNSIEAALIDIVDPIKKIMLIIQETTSRLADEKGDFIAIMMDFWAEGIRQKGTDSMHALNLDSIYSSFRELITGVLDEGMERGTFKPMDSATLSSILIATIDGLMLQWLIDPEKIDIKEATKLTLYGFLYGIIAKEYRV